MLRGGTELYTSQHNRDCPEVSSGCLSHELANDSVDSPTGYSQW